MWLYCVCAGVQQSGEKSLGSAGAAERPGSSKVAGRSCSSSGQHVVGRNSLQNGRYSSTCIRGLSGFVKFCKMFFRCIVMRHVCKISPQKCCGKILDLRKTLPQHNLVRQVKNGQPLCCRTQHVTAESKSLSTETTASDQVVLLDVEGKDFAKRELEVPPASSRRQWGVPKGTVVKQLNAAELSESGKSNVSDASTEGSKDEQALLNFGETGNVLRVLPQELWTNWTVRMCAKRNVHSLQTVKRRKLVPQSQSARNQPGKAPS